MKKEKRSKAATSQVAFLLSENDSLCVRGYVTLDKCPEIISGVLRIAEIIGSMTIYLMSNTDAGDVRIINELSRLIDINPMPNMTRMHWTQAFVKTLLLDGSGNAILMPHTRNGYLQSIEPIAASRVSFIPVSYSDYRVLIDGKERKPESLIHLVYNPDSVYMWKGNGITVSLRELARNLKQAQVTTNGFMASEWKPSLIARVDGLTDEFASPQGRQNLIREYLQPAEQGAPWVIPADLIDIQQVKPLTLKDLAIDETVTLSKRTVAALLGVPPFLLGVGEYDRLEWNNFVQTKIRSFCVAIQQELTKKLILSEKWYLRYNVWSLLDYDLKQISDVLLAGSDRGFISGDEWRDRVNLAPAGLDEYRVLENYIPWDMSGLQKKLVQEGE